MDDDNYPLLMQQAPVYYQHKIQYIMDYAPQYKDREVSDPYYGGNDGFERVLDKVEAAADGLLNSLLTTTQDFNYGDYFQ